MKDIKENTVKELVDELNKLDEEIKVLQEKQDVIIYELWDRIPSLKESEVFQPKVKQKYINK